jgi:Iron-containing redox enzyme
MLLTRPGYKYRAYGHFLVTEGWVAPHFERVVAGLQRVGLRHRAITVYFTAHLRIDPHHTDEMLEGLLYQQPALTQREIDEIILGAHSAASAGVHMYDRMLSHLKSIAC